MKQVDANAFQDAVIREEIYSILKALLNDVKYLNGEDLILLKKHLKKIVNY